MSRSTEDFRFVFCDAAHAERAARVLGAANGASLPSGFSAVAQGKEQLDAETVATHRLSEAALAGYTELCNMLRSLEGVVALETVQSEATLCCSLVVHEDLQEHAPPEGRELDFRRALQHLVENLEGISRAELPQVVGDAKQATLLDTGNAESTPEWLAATLTGLESTLSLLDRVFLGDFRMRVNSGCASDALSARAIEILAKHR